MMAAPAAEPPLLHDGRRRLRPEEEEKTMSVAAAAAPAAAPPEVLRRAKSAGGGDVIVAPSSEPLAPGVLLRARSLPLAACDHLDLAGAPGVLVARGGGGGGEEEESPAMSKKPKGRCVICLEDKPVSQLHISREICGNSECSEPFCRDCLKSYFQERVQSSRFSLLPMRCAACRGHVPFARWQGLAEETTLSAFVQNARDALALRCRSCDDTTTLLEDVWVSDREEAVRRVVNCSRDPAAIDAARSKFEAGCMDAESFLDLLRVQGPQSLQDAEPETRWACTSWGSYTLEQFLSWHGEDKGKAEWEVAEIDTSEDAELERRWACRAWDTYTFEEFVQWHGEADGPAKWEAAEINRHVARMADNGRTYTLEEFKDYYGEAPGLALWADAPVADVGPVLGLFDDDVERRAALRLADLRRRPKIRTPCCKAEYCFRCQTGSWHHGSTCEQILMSQAAIEVQFCPGCGVPTQRTEGCQSMVCLCGEHWAWGGDTSDDDYD